MAEQTQTDYEEALMKTVDEIWAKWDKDQNGTLDKSEMRGFVEATMAQAGINKQITDADFETIFAQFDLDGSNAIERDEMAVFVKKMAGI